MKLLVRIAAALAGLLVLGAAGLAYYLFLAGGLEKEVTRQIEQLLGESTPYRISIGKIGGSIDGTLHITELAIDYQDSIQTIRLARSHQVIATFNIADILASRFQLRSLYLDSVTIQVVQDSGGSVIGLPRRSSGSGTSTPVAVSIGELGIANAAVTVIRAEDTLHFQQISLDGALAIDAETYSLDLRQLSLRSNLPGLDSMILSGRITASSTALVAENLQLATELGAGKVSLAGDPGFTRVQAVVDLSEVSISRIGRLYGATVEGACSLSGTLRWSDSVLSGTVICSGDVNRIHVRRLFGRFAIDQTTLQLDTLDAELFDSTRLSGTASLQFAGVEPRYRFLGAVRRMILSDFTTVSIPTLLNGEVDMTGTSLRKDRFVLDVDARLDTSRFDDQIIEQFLGSATISGSELRLADSNLVRIASVPVRGGGTIVYNGEIDYSFSGQIEDIQRLSHLSGTTLLTGRAAVVGTLSGPTRDPALNARLVSDSIAAGELSSSSAELTVDLERAFSRRRGTIGLSLVAGTLAGQPFDSLFSAIRMDSTILLFDSLRLKNSYGIARVTGLLNAGERPMEVTVDSLQLLVDEYLFANRTPIVCEIDSHLVAIRQFVIGDQRASLSARGSIGYDRSLNGTLALDNLPIGSWLALISQEIPMTGDLYATAQVGGSMSEPLFSVEAEVDSLVYDSVFLGQAALHARYADTVMTLDSLVLSSFPGYLRAFGTFAADFSFERARFDALPAAPIDITIHAEENRFDLVTLIIPPIEEIRGDVRADVRLFGTPDEPRLSGQVTVTDGALKYLDLADTLRVDSGRVIMQDNRIIIDTVIAHVFNKRKMRRSDAVITGEIVVAALDSLYYNVDISLPRQFPFRYDLDDIEGVIEGDLHVEGYNAPLVTGDLSVVSMAYRANFAKANEGSPLMSALSGEKTWDLNLNFDLLSNYWIKNDDIDAEFAGDLNLIRTDGSYRFVGSLDILRGKAYLFDKTFRIEPGSSVSFDNTDSLNPTLDIYATTTVPGERSDSAGTRELIEVALHITGTLSNPDINPADNSPLSREEIFPLLVANYYVSDSTRAANNIESRVLSYVSNQVSQLGTRRIGRLIGVETFEIDPAVGGDLNLRTAAVTVGDYVVTNLYAYGRSSSSGLEVGAEYRLRRGLTLEGRRDEENLYHLGLKWRLEF